MLTLDPSQRISAEESLQHPFLKDLDPSRIIPPRYSHNTCKVPLFQKDLSTKSLKQQAKTAGNVDTYLQICSWCIYLLPSQSKHSKHGCFSTHTTDRQITIKKHRLPLEVLACCLSLMVRTARFQKRSKIFTFLRIHDFFPNFYVIICEMQPILLSGTNYLCKTNSFFHVFHVSTTIV